MCIHPHCIKSIFPIMINFRCTDFTKDDTRGWDFLTTRMNKHDESRPTYAKGGTWLSFFGHSITLYVRAVRTILNHAPIGEDRARFRPKSHPRARAVNQTLRPELRESQVHRQNDNRMTLPSPCLGDLVKFLTSNPMAFAFAPREPHSSPN